MRLNKFFFSKVSQQSSKQPLQNHDNPLPEFWRCHQDYRSGYFCRRAKRSHSRWRSRVQSRCASSSPVAMSHSLAVRSALDVPVLAIRRKSNIIDRVRVPLKGKDFLSRGNIPQMGRRVTGACQNIVTIRRKSYFIGNVRALEKSVR